MALGKKVEEYAEANLLLIKANDSLDKKRKQNNIKIEQLNQNLQELNKKKGLSTFEGILIGVGSVGLGVLIGTTL